MMENEKDEVLIPEVCLTKEELAKESEKLCRWGAARAGVIVVAPLVGSMALLANEVYMITRLAKLRGINLSNSALAAILGGLGGTIIGRTLVTMIPFAPLQLPIGISVTYGIGKVAEAWLDAGMPDEFDEFKDIFDSARKNALKQLSSFKEMKEKDIPLGDESKKFDFDEKK